MNVCILGWYGTETLGDRAILDGIIKVFSKTYSECNISIGSLYPFFTEHTLLEDEIDYLKNCNNISLSIFDERKEKSLTQNIKKSDLVIMGGGPIMNINELYIINKGFEIAKKNKIKTCLFGCGIGPLYEIKFINITKKILNNTDLGIFRDESSMKLAEEYCQKKHFYYLPDPAIISILLYRENNKNITKNNNLAINLRQHPKGYKNINKDIDDLLSDIVEKTSDYFENIQLIPMHTFFIGGDDRIILTEIKNKIKKDNIQVIYKPMSLYELYKIYLEAKACIGMRYHSIVMQTILNGNNYIIDYTSPKKGKITGFINKLSNKEFYNDRYYNYTTGEQIDVGNIHKILNNNKKYNYLYIDIISKYSNLLKGEI